MTPAQEGAAPLAGLTVLEIATFVAGPLGGMTLAQLGADVIRVDPVGGSADHGRWPLAPSGTSLYWTGLNKGKRSVTLNLRDPAGRRLLTDLVAKVGVVLTNTTVIGYEELVRARPDLIHVLIQGHRDGRPAVDYTVNAATGFPAVTGPESLSEPVNHVLPAWDVACGLYAAVGLLAAERRRQRTGRGSQITLALADVALAVTGHLGFLAQAQLGLAQPGLAQRPRIGNHLYGGFARDFATADGERVMIVALTSRHFADLAAVTGLAATFTELERLLGADFSTDDDRYRHREAIAALLSPWFSDKKYSLIARALERTSVLWSRYRRFTELAAEEMDNPLLSEISQPGVGTMLAPGSALFLDGALPARPAPVLGADTAAVLREVLGLSELEITEVLRTQ